MPRVGQVNGTGDARIDTVNRAQDFDRLQRGLVSARLIRGIARGASM
jgi:hypothetical protein